jgi:hypothetical protein
MTRRRERNFSHASHPVPAEDPQVLQVVGEIASDAFAARAIVLAAAQALQDASDSEIDGVFDLDAAYRAQIAAAQAKVAVDRFSYATATRLLDVRRFCHPGAPRPRSTLAQHPHDIDAQPDIPEGDRSWIATGQQDTTAAERILLTRRARPDGADELRKAIFGSLDS